MHPVTLPLRLLVFALLASCGLRAADTPPSPTPPADFHALLLEAVAGRRVVIFNYDGRRRVVEPHAYGESRQGRGLLRGYELAPAGTGQENRRSGWALFSLEKMSDLELSDRTFAEPRPGYRRGDRKIRRIHAEL